MRGPRIEPIMPRPWSRRFLSEYHLPSPLGLNSPTAASEPQFPTHFMLIVPSVRIALGMMVTVLPATEIFGLPTTISDSSQSVELRTKKRPVPSLTGSSKVIRSRLPGCTPIMLSEGSSASRTGGVSSLGEADELAIDPFCSMFNAALALIPEKGLPEKSVMAPAGISTEQSALKFLPGRIVSSECRMASWPEVMGMVSTMSPVEIFLIMTSPLPR